jgi:hypothetical protein
VAIETDDQGAEYLNFSVVFPPKELAAEATRKESAPNGVPTIGSWDDYIRRVDPLPQVREFLKKHLDEGLEESLSSGDPDWAGDQMSTKCSITKD